LHLKKSQGGYAVEVGDFGKIENDGRRLGTGNFLFDFLVKNIEIFPAKPSGKYDIKGVFFTLKGYPVKFLIHVLSVRLHDVLSEKI